MDRRTFLLATTAVAATGALSACGDTSQTQEAPSPLAPEFLNLDGLGLAETIKQGKISAAEATEASIKAIEALNPRINSVVTPTFERARERARSASATGPFGGVPTLLKDLMDYKGVRHTNGSRLFLDQISDWTSPYVEALEASGLTVLGKANTPEFGLLATTESLALGPCHNPWDLEHSTGGSSGGSAAAVASGMVPLAQSSDGGGSIRIPASCCGVFGLKPSRGKMKQDSRVPMPGDIGVRHVISRTVRDSAMALAVSEASGAEAAHSPTGYIDKPLDRPLKIAFNTANYFGDEPDDDVKLAIEQTAALCQSLGHEIIPVTTPVNGEEFVDHFLTVWASGPSQLKAAVEAQTGKPAEEVNLLEPWTLGLADFFNAKPETAMADALAYFSSATDSVVNWMRDYDVWLSPVLKSAPPKLGEQAPTVDFETLYHRTIHYVSYTPLHNVTGTPAMSVPLSWNEAGLPIGSQFAAAPGREDLLLSLALQLETAASWVGRRAPNSVWN